MSTCITKFCVNNEPVCAVFRQYDGEPDWAGADLIRFLVESKQFLKENGLDDPTLLAARYVVFLAREFTEDWDGSPMEFRGVRLIDPKEVYQNEYEYHVHCDRGGYLSRGIPDVRFYQNGAPLFVNLGKYRSQAFCELELTNGRELLTGS